MRSPKSRATPRGRPGTGRGNGGEFAAIERLQARLPGPPAGEVWIGDDAAVLRPRDGPLVLTTDLSVAGVHGDLRLIGLDDLGWRALAAAVSDVAAMGARPDGAVVAVAGPPSTDLDLLYEGIAASSEAHRCPVVGGDLSNAAEIVLAVAVTGHLEGDLGPVLRSGARAGDHLFVTGPLGAGAAGLRLLRARAEPRTRSERGARARVGASARSDEDVVLEAAHRRPRARLDEGETARLAGARAMVDVSDGLLADLGHVADASGVGFRLDDVPVSPGATIEDALGGGEDYELVVATPHPEQLVAAFADAGLRRPLPIGTCTADPTDRTLAGKPTTALGWEHSWG
jgi:thiamine-monophosphate kinase